MLYYLRTYRSLKLYNLSQTSQTILLHQLRFLHMYGYLTSMFLPNLVQYVFLSLKDAVWAQYPGKELVGAAPPTSSLGLPCSMFLG